MSDDLQTDAVRVRIDGRAYPVKFTGTSNQASFVEGGAYHDGKKMQYRHVQTKWGMGDADFYTPAVRLAHACVEVARTSGIDQLKALVERVDQTPVDAHEHMAFEAISHDFDPSPLFAISQYEQAWSKVMGNKQRPMIVADGATKLLVPDNTDGTVQKIQSAIIFRQDLKDIVRTIEEVYKAQESEKGAAR